MDASAVQSGSGTGADAALLVFAAFIGIYLVILGVILLLAIAWYVLWAIAYGRVFEKAGIPAWTAWVPYYNRWRLLELGGQPGWIVLLSLAGLGIVVTVFEIIGQYRLQIAFRKDPLHILWAIFLSPVWGFIMGSSATTYDPALIVAAGYPPPLIGYGSMPRYPGGQQYPSAGYPGPDGAAQSGYPGPGQ